MSNNINSAIELLQGTIKTIEKERSKHKLPPEQVLKLEKIAVDLRNAERSLVRKNESDLIKSIQDETPLLEQLTIEMEKEIKSLDEAIKKIETASALLKLVSKCLNKI